MEKKRKLVWILAAVALLALLAVIGLAQRPERPQTPEQAQPVSTEPAATAPVAQWVGAFEMKGSLERKLKTLYREGEKQTLYLSFFPQVEDAPFISITDAVALLTDHVRADRDPAYALQMKTAAEVITLTRDNGAYCTLDFEKGTVLFSEYNRFTTCSYELGALDILDAKGFNADGEAEYFQRVLCSEEPGGAYLLELHARGIPMVMENGEGYITLQTFSDLFLTPFEVMLGYNGKDVFFLDSQLLGPLEKTYYTEQPEERSQALADLTYRQLCLALDVHYGMAAEHGMEGADAFISRVGLKEAFYQDPQTAFTALKTLVYKYLSDNHSNVLLHSPYNPEPNYSLGAQEASVGYWEFYKNYQKYNACRAEQAEKGVQAYTEIGNTAFVVINGFTSATADYYEHSPLEGEYSDEIGLICYAHGQINRENSPIENVVIDLATNSGGHMDGGVFLTAWAFGNAIMHISDPIRGGNSTCIYRADVNLDRCFDAQDTLAGKNVYLLTSPITFSCANYVTAAFKESGTATVIGATTGGGAGCVYTVTTADGGAISLSSGLCMSEYKNGSYYSLDKGIAPDVKLTDITTVFDQKELARIIEKLP